MTPPICTDEHCPDHSGMIEQNRHNAETLTEVKSDTKEILSIVRRNEKRIDRVYIIFGTVTFMLSGAMGVTVLAIKLNWI